MHCVPRFAGWAQQERAEVFVCEVVTTGGSGLAKRDVMAPQLAIYQDYDYGSKGHIKKALKNLLQLHIQAEAGNSSSHAIWLDLQTALGRYHANTLLQVVTKKQKQAILLHLVYGYSEAEVAEALHISQQAVSCRVVSGIRRIQRFLETGSTTWNEWDDEEIELLLDHYADKGAQWCASTLNRPLTQVYSKARHLRRQGFLES